MPNTRHFMTKLEGLWQRTKEGSRCTTANARVSSIDVRFRVEQVVCSVCGLQQPLSKACSDCSAGTCAFHTFFYSCRHLVTPTCCVCDWLLRQILAVTFALSVRCTTTMWAKDNIIAKTAASAVSGARKIIYTAKRKC